MSDINNMNGRKRVRKQGTLTPAVANSKSRVLEERRREEERRRRREEERKRRLAIQRRKQAVTVAFLVLFIIVGISLIVINVNEMLKKETTVKKQTPVVEQDTTAPEVVSATLDLSTLVFTDDMEVYDNDPEMIQKLKDRLYSSEKEDPKLEFIIEHEQYYTPAMIEFLAKYEQVIDFVLKYPFRINDNHTSVVDISQDYTKGTVPTFIQWDDRWGYIPYGDNVIGDSGCGPTCLSMAVVALTGRSQYTPITMCKFAEDNGYYVDGVGTAWDLMQGGVEKLGLKSEKISISKDAIRLALSEDKLVILSMGPGIFTYSGHFILLYKYENGLFFVKDPNSREHTDTGFAYEEINDQIKSAWAIYE